MELSKTFCVYPWTHISMNTRGVFRPCCNTEGNIGLTIKDTSYLDAFTSVPMQDIRNQMLRGERPGICKVCWQKEDQGITSYRQLYNKQQSLTNLVDLRNPKLIYLDIKFDNKCNLQCAYCEENSSNQFEKAFVFFTKNNITLPINVTGRKIDFHPDEKLAKIKEILQDIRFIKVTGGEPMLSDHLLELIDYAIEKGYSENIEIRMTTNLTVISEKLMHKLSKFKKVYVGISIDAVGKLYDYIRYPFTFAKFEQRLDLFLSHLKRENLLNKFSFYFDCLLTSLNILNTNELVSWFNELPDRYDLPRELFMGTLDLNVHIAPHHHPLSVYRLPQYILDESMKRYQSTPMTNNSDAIFKSLVNTMPHDDLVEFIRIYDLQKGMNCKDYLDNTLLEIL